MKHVPPPWIAEGDTRHWVLASVAARFYFNKSIVTVKRYIKTGYLKEQGIPAYWDGKRWFIRLPVILGTPRRRQSRQIATKSA